MGNTVFQNEKRTILLPISTISLTDLLKKINPKDENFIKYIPDQFKNEVQIMVK